MIAKTDDLRITAIKPVVLPEVLTSNLPITQTAANTVLHSRQSIEAIMRQQDDRLLIIVGPCSIHDRKAALEYAQRLSNLREEHAENLLLLMRVYFEKPRTTTGWKGMINDPDLNESFNINKGLHQARSMLLAINELGVGTGSEFLDLMTPQYLMDLVSWGAIGARTVESQLHRELASGLSCPVGLKNGTDGNVKIAVDAIRAANNPHHFLSVTKQGHSGIFSTTGNLYCHIILRGGKTPNYDQQSVNDACAMLANANLPTQLMIDCSHANSHKNHLRQLEVCDDLCKQMEGGDRRIFGVMLESHLYPGRQDLIPGQPLAYGTSITDACLGWEDTERALTMLAKAVVARRNAQ